MLGPPMKRRLALALVSALLLAVACKKQARSQAPAGDAATAEPAASLDDLERELGELEDELARRGGAKTETAGDAAATDLEEDRCERTCDLASAICGIKDRICGMVADHEDEPRYADACTRATDDCDRASEACDGCKE
jgi:hypothetical protein